MSTHEIYVSLEVAKLLKEAGFDWEVSQLYEVLSNRQVMQSDVSTYNWNNPCYGESTFSMPTLSVAQKWLREAKNEIVLVDAMAPKSYSVAILGRNSTTKKFDTYEQALEAGIKKVLKLILKKGE